MIYNNLYYSVRDLQKCQTLNAINPCIQFVAGNKGFSCLLDKPHKYTENLLMKHTIKNQDGQ